MGRANLVFTHAPSRTAIICGSLALGCGGKTSQTPCLDCSEGLGASSAYAPAGDEDSGSSGSEYGTSRPDEAEGYGAGEPAEPDPPDDEYGYGGYDGAHERDGDPCPPVPAFELLREVPLYEYGRWDNSFQLSADGETLLLFDEFYTSEHMLRQIDLVGGGLELVPWFRVGHTSELEVHLGEDAFEVSRAGELLWEKPVGTPFGVDVAFSSDDEVLLFGSCPDGSLVLERYQAETGELLSQLETGLGCSYGQPMSELAEAGGVTVLRLQTVEAGFFQVSDAGLSPIQPEGLGEPSTLTEVGLSPDGTRLVLGYRIGDYASTDMRLAMIAMPSQEVIVDDLPSLLTVGYTNTYTAELRTVPVAWAPDGSYFVASNAEGDIQLVSTCDGSVRSPLPDAAESGAYVGWQGSEVLENSWSRDTAAASNLAFNAKGDRFVAYFVGRGLRVYDVSY